MKRFFGISIRDKIRTAATPAVSKIITQSAKENKLSDEDIPIDMRVDKKRLVTDTVFRIKGSNGIAACGKRRIDFRRISQKRRAVRHALA